METLAVKLQTADERIAQWAADPCTCPRKTKITPLPVPCHRCRMLGSWQQAAATLEAETRAAVAYLAARKVATD